MDNEIDGYELRRRAILERILDAAEALIRERGPGFTMRELADQAGVSPATPFNHLQTKMGVFAALVDRSLENLAVSKNAPSGDDPVDCLLQAADCVTAHYANDPDLYRPVFGALLGLPHGHDSPLMRAVAMWSSGLHTLADTGMLRGALDTNVVALQLELVWLGTLVGWVGCGLDANAWRRHVEIGVATTLAAVVDHRYRGELLDRISSVIGSDTRHDDQ
ncbi:TetR/AcrR family transcriptional regulator [Mycolicibacterium frederiksbergense]|uniref:TetR/AcrR family transcriptional regulator n=1 Tax=Mycolicibacterium frederiksbergense TaxID=117567 RepID=UPI0024751560|nr:TetR/AcrR family transcriptional regulator [Mycolicibacterium frederiksbergense]